MKSIHVITDAHMLEMRGNGGKCILKMEPDHHFL